MSRLLLRAFALASLVSALTAAAAAQPASPYTTAPELIADGFTHPVTLAEPPDNPGRRFDVDQTEQVWLGNHLGGRAPR